MSENTQRQFADERTKFVSKEQAEAFRGWRVIDANGLPLGRLASEVATILRGKDKPAFTPHVDMGDFVVITNADKIVLRGRKMEQKVYYSHSGYAGGLKATPAAHMHENNPERMVTLAVRRMLPRGPLGRKMLKKLKVYRGAEHPHSAQNPQEFKLQYYKN